MNASTHTLENLQRAGGNLWERDSIRRVYYPNLVELFGLDVNLYKSGNVSSASLNGETISNARASEISNALGCGKLWYDLTACKWQFRIANCRGYTAEDMA